MRNTLDRSSEPNADRAAAHVAVFAVLACSDLGDSGALKDLALEPYGLLDREVVTQRLAELPKPLWVDGTVHGSGMSLRAGPLHDRPDLQRRYEVWHRNRRERDTTHPAPQEHDVVLCCTDAHALRVHWRDFVKYQQDYILASDFSYGMSDVGGQSPSLRQFDYAELEGVAWTIRISRPGPILIFEDGEQ